MELLIINDRGQSLFVGIFVLMISSLLSLTYLQKRMKRIEIQKEKQRLLLCTKELNGLNTKLIADIKLTNKWIKRLSISKLVTIVLPQFGILSKLTLSKAIKQLKLFQKLKLLSYLKNISQMKLKKCSFSLSAYKTPIKINLKQLSIARNKYGEAITRENNWTYTTYSKLEIILNQYSQGAIKSKLIKKENHYWN